MSHRVSQTYTPDEVKHAFKVCHCELWFGPTPPCIDAVVLPAQVFQGPDAGPNQINVKNLEKALLTYSGDKQAVAEAVDLLLQVDPDGTGYVNYVEYVDMMTVRHA